MSPGRIRAFYTFGIAAIAAAACAGAALYAGCGDGDPFDSDGGNGARSSGDSGIPRDATFVDGTSDAGAPSCDGQDASFGAPTDLACTGLYTRTQSSASTTPHSEIASDVRAYTPDTPAWAGGESARWVHVPEGATVDPRTNVYPVGFKAWQEIAADGKRIETRFLWKRAEDTWVRAVYAWSDDDTQAIAIAAGRDHARGTAHAIPPVASCDSCHTQAHAVLGFAPLRDTGGDADEGHAWLAANCGASCHDGTRAHAKDLRAGACVSMDEARASLARVKTADPLARMPPFAWMPPDPNGARALQRSIDQRLFPTACGR